MALCGIGSLVWFGNISVVFQVCSILCSTAWSCVPSLWNVIDFGMRFIFWYYVCKIAYYLLERVAICLRCPFEMIKCIFTGEMYLSGSANNLPREFLKFVLHSYSEKYETYSELITQFEYKTRTQLDQYRLDKSSIILVDYVNKTTPNSDLVTVIEKSIEMYPDFKSAQAAHLYEDSDVFALEIVPELFAKYLERKVERLTNPMTNICKMCKQAIVSVVNYIFG